jgi:hypothetical protein
MVRRTVLVGVQGIGMEGTAKKHRSDEGALVPVRKGREEVGVLKRQTDVLVKTAWPCGLRRGEMPIREWDKAESGRK